jgi:hypothetical protein
MPGLLAHRNCEIINGCCCLSLLFVVLGFMLTRKVLYHVNHSTSCFVLSILEIGSLELFAMAGLTAILVISTSQVARITDMRHQAGVVLSC